MRSGGNYMLNTANMNTPIQYIASWNIAETNEIKTVLINKATNYDHAIQNINKVFPNATCINIDIRGKEIGYPEPTGILNC